MTPDDGGRDLPETLSEQALLRIVTENARVGLVVLGPDRRYVYANRTYGEILDLSTSGLAGRPLQEVLAGVYEDQVRPRLDRAFAGERVAYELRKPTADGDRFYAVRYEPTTAGDSVALVVVVITDITDTRRRQIDLGRYAAIVESSDDAIVSKDLNGIVTSWNQGAERLFGYSAAEMVGTPILRIIPEHLEAEEREILERIRRNERIQHLETLRRTKDGRTIAVSISTSPILHASGKVIGASKVARDITARKQADDELRFQRAMLLTERELTLDGILAVDAHSSVLSYNGRFAEMWGVPPDLLAARADAALLESAKRKVLNPEAFMRRVQELYDRHDETSEDEVELLDGRIFDRYSAPMRDADGRYYGRVWYFRDVTEQKRAEEALRQALDRAQRYLDTAEVMLLSLDAEGRITSINRKGCEILGYTERELLGCNWIETCLPARARATLAETFDDLLAGNTSFVENPVLTKTSEERLIEWRNRVLHDEMGNVIGTFSSGADITERRSLEERYHQAQKMEAVGRLAGGVAHDFNNLLSVILGYSQLLLEQLDPLDPRRPDITEIHRAGESAAGLTRQLLTFSRKQMIAPKVLDLNTVVSGVQKMLGRLMGEDVRVMLDLRPGLDLVMADPGQVEQIVMNLAVNARDAMPDGGTLTIETANVELDEHYARTHIAVKPGRYVQLIVSDTGTGMSPEIQSRLFEPFFTTKEPGKGTGLGLATVHGIVTRSGGTVGVYSEPGKGTTFIVYFPRVPAGATAPEEPRLGVETHAGGQTVLVVEDAAPLRELARRLLQREGYSVLVAANAAEALQTVEEHPSIDVVLTDVVMPGGSGPELTRQLVQQRTGLKVVYMSGYTEDAISHHGVLDPGIAFLHKPFSRESLAAKLREVLAG